MKQKQKVKVSQTVIVNLPKRSRRGKVAPAKQVVVPQIIPQYIPQQISMSDIQNAIRSEIGKGVRLGGEALGSMRMPEMPMAIPPPVYTEPPLPAYTEPPVPVYEPMRVQSEIRREVRFNAEAPNEIRIEPELAHERRLVDEPLALIIPEVQEQEELGVIPRGAYRANLILSNYAKALDTKRTTKQFAKEFFKDTGVVYVPGQPLKMVEALQNAGIDVRPIGRQSPLKEM